MKTSFADIGEITEPAKTGPTTATDTNAAGTPPVSQALVPVAENQVVPDSFFSNAEMEGDFDRSDIQLPRLSLVHGIGPLSEHFTPGHLVYNKELDLGAGPLEVTLVRMRKYYMEDHAWGSEDIPRVVNSIDEMRKLGGYLTSEKREMGEGHPYFKPVLDAQVIIKGAPDNSAFPYEFGGVPYAVAVWTLQGIAYTRAAKPFITASQFGLRAGLTTAHWSVTTKREKFGQNLVWFPVVRQAGRNSIEFIEWIKTLSNS